VRGLRQYLEAVTLGAFSYRDALKAGRFLSLMRETPARFFLLHLVLVSLALNFPLMLSIARLPPHETFARLYGEGFVREFAALPEEARHDRAFQNGAAPQGAAAQKALIDDFDLYLYEKGYGRTVMLPLMGMAFILVLILQGVFYLIGACFMGLHRMNGSSLSFSAALRFLVFSSTLPAFLAALLGLRLPAVHIVMFYLAVIIISFHRSKLCQNG
jgi:hypothetical protein